MKPLNIQRLEVKNNANTIELCYGSRALYLLEEEIKPWGEQEWRRLVFDLSSVAIFERERLRLFRADAEGQIVDAEWDCSCHVIYMDNVRLFSAMRAIRAKKLPSAQIDIERIRPRRYEVKPMTVVEMSRHPNLSHGGFGQTLKYFLNRLRPENFEKLKKTFTLTAVSPMDAALTAASSRTTMTLESTHEQAAEVYLRIHR